MQTQCTCARRFRPRSGRLPRRRHKLWPRWRRAAPKAILGWRHLFASARTWWRNGRNAIGRRMLPWRSQPDQRDRAAESANAARLAAIDDRIAHIDKRLTANFPDYAALAMPVPLTVEEVQAQLGADEALVLFLDTPRLQPITRRLSFGSLPRPPCAGFGPTLAVWRSPARCRRCAAVSTQRHGTARAAPAAPIS